MNTSITNFTSAAIVHFASLIFREQFVEKKCFPITHNKQMESKVCVICKTEKKIDNFWNKYSQCK